MTLTETPPSDPQAGKIVREGSEEHKEWAFGYRLHLIVDANWELPVAKEVTLAEDNEKIATIPLLQKAKRSAYLGLSPTP